MDSRKKKFNNFPTRNKLFSVREKERTIRREVLIWKTII